MRFKTHGKINPTIIQTWLKKHVFGIKFGSILVIFWDNFVFLEALGTGFPSWLSFSSFWAPLAEIKEIPATTYKIPATFVRPSSHHYQHFPTTAKLPLLTHTPHCRQQRLHHDLTNMQRYSIHISQIHYVKPWAGFTRWSSTYTTRFTGLINNSTRCSNNTKAIWRHSQIR